MLEFALKQDRKRYHAEMADSLRSEPSLHAADTPSPAPPLIPDSEVPLSAADQSAKQLQQIPPSVVPFETPPPAPALAASTHTLSKALNHTRSREILKTYLLEANHLLACASLPPVSTTPMPRGVPDVSVLVGGVGDVLEDEEEEEGEEEELRFRTRGPGISESMGVMNRERGDAGHQEQSQKHVTILKKKALLVSSKGASSPSSSAAAASKSVSHSGHDSDASDATMGGSLNGGKRNKREYTSDAAVPSSNGNSTVATDNEDGYELG
ncbi:hypothetical protein HDU98_006575, partial [Podochytrium sp. JEL0797]